MRLLIGAWPAAAAAQVSPDAAWRCDGMVVSTVVIERQPPTMIGESAPEWARPFLSVALQHRTTHAVAVRPFLLLEEGMPCTEVRRAESERLLRAQPYLADAAVTVAPDGGGGIRVAVATVDEIPLVIGARARGGRISGITYGSSNVLGQGMYASAEWREGFAYRDGLGVRFINHHAFGVPNRFSLSLERTPQSAFGSIALERPLLTSHQRVSWHAGVSDGSEYARFVRQSGPPLALAVDRSRLDLGATFRVGREQRRIFAGPFVSHQRVDPATRAVVLTDTGFAVDPDPALSDRFAPVHRTRVAAAAGVRVLSFTRAQGLDALVGVQDFARGVQIAAIAGRSFLSGRDAKVFGVDLYAGAGSRAWFVAAGGQWEGEKQHTGNWVDAIAGGRIALHYKPSERRTLIARGEFAGAWGARTPYQIPLGDEGGVRGYHDSRVMGGRRAVARAEHRWVLGNVTRFMVAGATGFVDIGSVWAGGVPYGQNSGIRTGVGVGLLAAVPPQSRRMIRVDFALPLVSDPHASYELRAAVSAPARMFWRDPEAVARIRAIVPRSGIFSLP